jgi:hypothetical protein
MYRKCEKKGEIHIISKILKGNTPSACEGKDNFIKMAEEDIKTVESKLDSQNCGNVVGDDDDGDDDDGDDDDDYTSESKQSNERQSNEDKWNWNGGDKHCKELTKLKNTINQYLKENRPNSRDSSSEIDVQSVVESIAKINNEDRNAFVLNLQSKFNTISGEINNKKFLESMESLIDSRTGIPYNNPLSFYRKNGQPGSATLNNIYEELRRTPNGGKKTRRKKSKKTRTRKSRKVKRSKKRAKKQ